MCTERLEKVIVWLACENLPLLDSVQTSLAARETFQTFDPLDPFSARQNDPPSSLTFPCTGQQSPFLDHSEDGSVHSLETYGT